VEFITQYEPRPVQYAQAGKVYFGNVGPGMHGWEIVNGAPVNGYLGAGGTHSLPDAAYQVSGPWGDDLEMDAGAYNVLHLHCNLHGCNRWNSGYNLFYMDAAVGWDNLNYQPQTSTAQWNLGGTPYTFSPSAFSAGTINNGTINSGTLNVTKINGGVFGASGAAHATGTVPDPGATAGSTRFLREDGTWIAPVSSGGSGGSTSGGAGGDLSGSYPNPIVTQAQGGAIAFKSGSGGAYAQVGTSTPIITQNVVGQQAAWTYNCLYNGSNWAYVGSDGCAGFRVYGSLVRLITNPTGTAGASVTSMDAGTSVGCVYSSGNRPCYFNYSGESPTGILSTDSLVVNQSRSFVVDTSGQVTAAAYIGPAAAPSGSCATNGAWVFSQDGHATFCASGSWVTKL
jgi:hypothetical protein